MIRFVVLTGVAVAFAVSTCSAEARWTWSRRTSTCPDGQCAAPAMQVSIPQVATSQAATTEVANENATVRVDRAAATNTLVPTRVSRTIRTQGRFVRSRR